MSCLKAYQCACNQWHCSQLVRWVYQQELNRVEIATAQILVPNYITSTRWQWPYPRYFGFIAGSGDMSSNCLYSLWLSRIFNGHMRRDWSSRLTLSKKANILFPKCWTLLTRPFTVYRVLPVANISSDSVRMMKIPLIWEEEKWVHLFMHASYCQEMKEISLIFYHLFCRSIAAYAF